jgi:hypothetical protein
MDVPGSETQQLLQAVERFMTKYDQSISVSEPNFFNVPAFCRTTDVEPPCTGTVLPGTGDWVRKTSPIDAGFIARNPLDYLGDGRDRIDSVDFDALLARVAQSYRPAGCPDPERIRVVFTVDFNEGGQERQLWEHQPVQVGHRSPGQRHVLRRLDLRRLRRAAALGHQRPAVRDGDGIQHSQRGPDVRRRDQRGRDLRRRYLVDLLRPAQGQPRQGLSYGLQVHLGDPGAGWSGSEEWPGNSRILEVVDDNDDDFVYRHDVFGDEATNKDKSNLNLTGRGTIDWTRIFTAAGRPRAMKTSSTTTNACVAASSPRTGSGR